MSLKSPGHRPITATPPNPKRTGVADDSEWEDLLERLRTSYWQDATFLHSLAKDKKAAFKGLSEYEAIDCIQGCLAEISLILGKRCFQDNVSSLRVKRTDTDIRAWFGDDSVDLSTLVRGMVASADQLSRDDSKVVSDAILDQLFHDEIGLPGFARCVLDGDAVDFTRLPDDAEEQLRYRETRHPHIGGHAVTDD